MRRLFMFSALLCLLVLTSCTPTDNFSAGRPLTSDELASLSAELSTETDGPDTGNGEINPQSKVYWTEGGSVYHPDRECHHLRNSDEVKSGTVHTARVFGKERACSACGGD